MSEIPESPDQPLEPSDEEDINFPEMTPLQELAVEMSEVYDALMYADLSPQVGAWVIASMMSEALGGMLDGDDTETSVEISLEDEDEDPGVE